MVLRVALISDSHGQVDERILALLAGCDLVVHAGDIGGPRVLEALEAIGARWLAVRGNNDTERVWRGAEQRLAALPTELREPLPGGVLAAEHGHRAGAPAARHQRLRQRYRQARAVVYGHSHRLVQDQTARPWVLNPGACGRARTYGGPSCLILRAGVRVWRTELHRLPR
jgi:putative phosphoesterase